MFPERIVGEIHPPAIGDEWKMMFLVLKKRKMCRNIYCVIPEARTLSVPSQISRIGDSQHAGSFVARGGPQLIAVCVSGGTRSRG